MEKPTPTLRVESRLLGSTRPQTTESRGCGAAAPSLAARLSRLLPLLWCVGVFPACGPCVQECESQHSIVHPSIPSAPFYKSAISLTLDKHSSALPKAEQPIDLNYWPPCGSRCRPLLALNEMKVVLSHVGYTLPLFADHTQKAHLTLLYHCIRVDYRCPFSYHLANNRPLCSLKGHSV